MGPKEQGQGPYTQRSKSRGRPSKRSFARELGLRVKDNQYSRVVFANVGSNTTKIVHAMWLDTEHARNGGYPYAERQAFEEIVRLVDVYGEHIWCHDDDGDRSHLLYAGEYEDYVEDFYWPEHREKILEIFRRLYNEPLPGTAKKRQRESMEAASFVYTFPPPIQPRDSVEKSFQAQGDSTTGLPRFDICEADLMGQDLCTCNKCRQQLHDTVHVESDCLSPSSEDGDYDLFKTHIWLKDSTNTFTAQILLGKIATVTAFFEAICDAFIETNPSDRAAIMAKGVVEVVKLTVWNLGPGSMMGHGLENPIVVDSRRPNDFVRFRDDVAKGFLQNREDSQGERVLCFATVRFEKDPV